ncbi:PilX N-terminal domain-containing pilus assembly protein [Ralstonia sp. SET104]|uniref:PilX N-terminal domain-containing pilus assembly protein n=1 Tax=Ralstonia sp. SET104 TaxID=2448774 RepID=UPI000F564089|nr:PilX N-terminal domain-containing pilus assembly protein [Ralstonia sp. SET104]GCB06646.1 hypothetical protein PSUB009319_42770 [Ralstonia sp. SET104]
MKPLSSRQRGFTLLVGLIMLLLLTLLGITAFRLAKGNLQVVGNAQSRDQARSAAQGAIEQVVSSTQFTTTPTNAIPNPCKATGPNTTCVDINGDGVTDITVAVTPACVSTQVISESALNYSDPNDAGCLQGAPQDFGVAGAANNNSMCANSLWNVQAVATDVITSARYVVNQGTAVRVPATSVCP